MTRTQTYQVPKGKTKNGIAPVPIIVNSAKHQGDQPASVRANLLGIIPFAKKLFSKKESQQMAVAPKPLPEGELVISFYDSAKELLSTEILSLKSENEWETLAFSAKADEKGFVSASIRGTSSAPAKFDDFSIQLKSLYSAKLYQENHYYPFGMNMKGLESQDVQTVQNKDEHLWQYNSKERQDDFDLFWLDYGARNYDAQVGRWHSVDLLAEKYDSWSSYNYVLNNPINSIDPDGMRVINGEALRLQLAEVRATETQAKFDKDYNGDENLTKDDFDTKQDWKAYKNARSGLKASKKAVVEAQKSFEYVESLIELHKKVDGEGFNYIDNITYKDSEGKERALDVMVFAPSSSEETGQNGGGATLFSISDLPTGGGRGIVFHAPFGGSPANTVGIFLKRGEPLTGNKLSHEFGHVEAIARDPFEYYTQNVLKGDKSCQDFPYQYVSKDATKWQSRWDTKYFGFSRLKNTKIKK